MNDTWTFIDNPYPTLITWNSVIHSPYAGLVFMAILIVVSIAFYILTRSLFICSITSLLCLLVGSFIGVISWWISFFFFMFSLFGFIFILDRTPSEVPTVPNEAQDYWTQYGNKLKEAYSAKFGGENSGFNDEVNKRIVVMQKLKHGISNTLARDWLKRMKNFTECK